MQFFEAKIVKFYKKHGRKNLPWRRKGITPYEVWVSEIMLQQTQVNRVIEYFNRFIKKYPTIQDLSLTTWDDFLPYYAGLGYYNRGRNMIKTAKIVVQEYGEVFPKDAKELQKLPGIGEYTANAILSFGFNKDTIAFDTNLQKVFGRFLHGTKNAKIDRENLEKKLKENKKFLNGALMDFASLICTKNPKCKECTLQKKCVYFLEKGKKEIQEEMNTIKKKNTFPNKQAQVFLWLHENHKKYFSPNVDTFEVFKIPESKNTRAKIKEWFLKKYEIKVSVRPPHKKTYINGVPTLFVNAQILKGEHEFGEFTKKEISIL